MARAQLHPISLGPVNSRDDDFARGELSFFDAKGTGNPAYYPACALYAYAFRLSDGAAHRPSVFDRPFRQAWDFSNRGFTEVLKSVDESGTNVQGGNHELPFGQLKVESRDEHPLSKNGEASLWNFFQPGNKSSEKFMAKTTFHKDRS